jgi:photosynthetic reaction center cytochrome c subunit
MTFTFRIVVAFLLLIGVGLLFTFERPPVQSVQRGFRGTGMDLIYNPRAPTSAPDINVIPASLPRVVAGPKASTVYKNVQVLGDLSVGEFTRLMASITTWVAPQQGCNYCHNPANMAEDSVYTKVVARRMIQMVRHVNTDWTSHVQATGVTCWTCHRGQPVPAKVWFTDPGQQHFVGGAAETATGKNRASTSVGLASLPYDPFTPFLSDKANIRIQSTTALPEADNSSIKQAEWTYGLMVHFSESLGVNCNYCHNSRAFGAWDQSPPQRAVAWYGIRMARDLNAEYLAPLHDVFPAYRLGPTGDVAKINCATCHQGAYKPLYGQSMIKDFPELAVALPK